MLNTWERYIVDQITRFMGWVRRNRQLEPPVNGPVKVNLGSGLNVAPGWLNIDGSLNALIATVPKWMHPLAYRLSGANHFYSREFYCEVLRSHTFIHHNLIYGIPLPDQSADWVYSSHFLEHLDRQNGRRLLVECLRVLKPGGVVRIGVPDLAMAWEMYQHGDKEQMLETYFFVPNATSFSQHRYAYDCDILSHSLLEVGFNDVQRVGFKEGVVPDLEILDHYQEYTLFVQGRRPFDTGGQVE